MIDFIKKFLLLLLALAIVVYFVYEIFLVLGIFFLALHLCLVVLSKKDFF